MTNERFDLIRSEVEDQKEHGLGPERRYVGDAYADRIWMLAEITQLRSEVDAAYNRGFAEGSGNEGEYQREIARLKDALKRVRRIAAEGTTHIGMIAALGILVDRTLNPGNGPLPPDYRYSAASDPCAHCEAPDLHASHEPIEALPHASEALKQFMSELGEIMGMEDGTKPADYLQRAQDIRQWCSDHQTLPPWIPITERVPEPEVLVLCWDGYKTFVEWFGNKPDAGRGVTHWVPYQMPPGAVSNMHEGRRAFADGPEKRAEPSEPLDKKSFERNCGHYHFQDYCDECNRVWSLIESCTPRQEAAEQRWLLLAHILDESAETGKLPSGLHEAFQMGGDAMAEWLDRRAAEKSGALQNHPDYDPVCPQGHRCTKDARSIWQCILCQWIAQP